MMTSGWRAPRLVSPPPGAPYQSPWNPAARLVMLPEAATAIRTRPQCSSPDETNSVAARRRAVRFSGAVSTRRSTDEAQEPGNAACAIPRTPERQP